MTPRASCRTRRTFETRTEAVIYLRVSTKEQAERGGESEGFSIPAQREACTRKALDLGLTVAAEFIDAGESARPADRPELQRMLTYLAENPTSAVIVHKVDRLARNRADDVQISLAIQSSGAKLVSVTEKIDDTPQGKLMHTSFSGLAAFHSDTSPPKSSRAPSRRCWPAALP
jgi:site-specific DNA recombinase